MKDMGYPGGPAVVALPLPSLATPPLAINVPTRYHHVSRTRPGPQALWGHLFSNLPIPKVDLTGRTVLVTGGNTGLGYAAVLHFARSNASRIIIASRSLTRCSAAAEKVYQDVPTYRGVVDVLGVDLTSFDSVISFAKTVNADKGRLDIVVANAGIFRASYEETKDGYEAVLQANALSTALMALLLLPKLEQTAGMEVPLGSKHMKPTLSIVTSEAHYIAKFPQKSAPGSLIGALNDPSQFVDGYERYSVSKLLNLYATRAIVKLPAVSSGEVVVNCVNPGLCASGLHDSVGPVFAWLIKSIAWAPEKGARNYLYATTQNTTPGAYVSYCTETPPSFTLFSDAGRALQKKFWQEAMDIFRGLGVGEGLDRALRA